MHCLQDIETVLLSAQLGLLPNRLKPHFFCFFWPSDKAAFVLRLSISFACFIRLILVQTAPGRDKEMGLFSFYEAQRAQANQEVCSGFEVEGSKPAVVTFLRFVASQ